MEEIFDIIEFYDEQIEILQNNSTETHNEIENIKILEENHQKLRNDHENLKYDFRSFTLEISQWQINFDERLNKTESQIQDLNQIISGKTTTEPLTTTTRTSATDECA